MKKIFSWFKKKEKFYGKCWIKQCKKTQDLLYEVFNHKKWMDYEDISKYAERCDKCFYNWGYLGEVSRNTRAIASALNNAFK